jgi:hypothetical protein
MIADAIEGVTPLATSLYDTGIPHRGKVLRQVGGRGAYRTDEPSDGMLSAAERLDQGKPGRVREYPTRAGVELEQAALTERSRLGVTHSLSHFSNH